MKFDGGKELRRARDQKLLREMKLKRAARQYDAWAASAGLSPANANFYAPPQVVAGRSLIARDRKAAIHREVHAQKEKLKRQFAV